MIRNLYRYYNIPLLLIILTIFFFGLIFVYSASSEASIIFRADLESDYFLKRQFMIMLAGIAFMLLLSLFPYQLLKKGQFVLLILFIVFIMLFATLLFADEQNGATSWLFGLQPSEFVKLAIIIYMAAVITNKQSKINNLVESFAAPALVCIFVFLLIYFQNDLGTAALIALIAMALTICSGTKIIKLLLILLGIGVGSSFILFHTISDVQRNRIVSFTENPFDDPLGSGLQLSSSFMALGNGGVEGLGLGASIQKTNGYLPEAYTDFILAVIAEETGVFGVTLVFLLLLSIISIGFYTAWRCKDAFGSLLAVGISCMIGFQALVNLGGLSQRIPLTGVPLPFISYGGSSLLVCLIGAGILLNISLQNRMALDKKRNG